MKKKNILFVCKHNVFRSQVAKSYFNKINKNKLIKVDSAGIIKGYALNDRQIKVAKDLGINLKGKPKGLSIDLVKRQNMIIIAADDVPKTLFNRKEYINFKTTKIIWWKIPDNLGATNDAKLRKIIKLIIKKVDKLNKQLNEK